MNNLANLIDSSGISYASFYIMNYINNEKTKHNLYCDLIETTLPVWESFALKNNNDEIPLFLPRNLLKSIKNKNTNQDDLDLVGISLDSRAFFQHKPEDECLQSILYLGEGHIKEAVQIAIDIGLKNTDINKEQEIVIKRYCQAVDY